MEKLLKPLSVQELADMAKKNDCCIAIDLNQYTEALQETKLGNNGRMPEKFKVTVSLYHVSLDPKDKG